jgi:hypothetical protein
MSHRRHHTISVKSRLAAGLFFVIVLSAAHPPLHAQGSLWIITTPLGDERSHPRDIAIRADRITLNDRKPPADILLENVLELSVFRPSTFWDGAKDGGLIGAGIGAVGGLAAGVVWSSSGDGNAAETVLLSAAAGGVVFGIVGGLIGGFVHSLSSDETHDLRMMSADERRALMVELQQEAKLRE